MKPMALSRVAQVTGGTLHGDDVLVDALATDTRTLDCNDQRLALFVALAGERFDGHDHVAAAAERGAHAALVSRRVDVALPQVVVADTELALAALAAALQHARATTVIAITGSNGKTSVKALLSAILQHAVRADGGIAYANPGNRNNEIGLPLAVIEAPDDARFAIYEMGAGKPGDIAYLARVARPHVSLVNNISAAHIERLGSLLGVADTKAAILDALPGDGVAVINADDAFAAYFAERAGDRRIIRFGLEASADVSARDLRLDARGARFTLCTPEGEAEVELALPGRHNACNALAAASLALAVGIAPATIAAGLATALPVPGRVMTRQLNSGAVLIDDSYNANPGSLDAAIATLVAEPGEAWLVLGDMRELGSEAASLHADAGRRARAAGVARLYTLGPLSAVAAEAFGEGARSFETHAALAEAVRAGLRPGVRVLVKGSRGSAMERVVTSLLSGEDATHAA